MPLHNDVNVDSAINSYNKTKVVAQVVIDCLKGEGNIVDITLFV